MTKVNDMGRRLATWCWREASVPTSDALQRLAAQEARDIGAAFFDEMRSRADATNAAEACEGRPCLRRDDAQRTYAVVAGLRYRGGDEAVAGFLSADAPCLNSAAVCLRLGLDVSPYCLDDGRWAAPDVRLADADAISRYVLPSASVWVLHDKPPLRPSQVAHWSRARIASAWNLLPHVVVPITKRLTDALAQSGTGWCAAIGHEVHRESLRHLDRTLPGMLTALITAPMSSSKAHDALAALSECGIAR